MVKPELFYARFNEEWKVTERCDRTEYKAKCRKLGETQ